MNTENKPKTSNTVNATTTLTPRITSRQWLDESVTDHLNCVLCGSTLEFKHVISYVDGTVGEEANCPSCRVRGRQSSHSLQ